ncbi:serine hydrolase domain-containing protein [Streptomyces ficellus]|uniref:Class A beta-lactamase-related serine hydrolase n=1 Tax=Streptomyces ficellus TaxID=1977088 RepID=A0A6I6FNH7_9ACTN|nr:serine hydrolase domain-containing protein [Streptomyces ficellus]QGV80779.1 class A beta-lactamase-related serine hydrolase [Streptomyces ficellus]
MSGERAVRGTVAEGFEAVREEFTAVVREERPDYSGQLCAYVQGRKVVDLWAGPDTDGDTLHGVYSSTKGAAHLVVALLVQDGTLDLDREVAHYWPEFAAAGKEAVTLRDLLAHRAGLVGADGGFTFEELADDRVIAERLAGQRPYWRPGAAFGYHAYVIGALTGEVVFRATGRTLQDLFEERVRAPYGLDFHLGLPEEHEPRFRPVLPMDPTPEQRAELDAAPVPDVPGTLLSIAYNRNGAQPTDIETVPNSRLVRAKGPASVGGVASARGLAGMYAAAISGTAGRPPLLDADTAARFAQLHSVGHDLVAGARRSYGLGFINPALLYPFLGAGSFGHSGAGGSQAFADPRAGLAYGYTRRRFPFPGGAAEENARLVRVVHTAARAR